MALLGKLALPYQYAYTKRAKAMQLQPLQKKKHCLSKQTRHDCADPFGSGALEAGHLEDHVRYSSQARYYQPVDNAKINQILATSRNISTSGSVATLPPYQGTSSTHSPSCLIDHLNRYESDRGRWQIRSPTTLQSSTFVAEHGERAVYSPVSDAECYLRIPLSESRPGSTTPQTMNRSYSAFPDTGYDTMRPSSRGGLSSPPPSQARSPIIGFLPGTAHSQRTGIETPSSPTVVQKSYPPLSRPGTAIARDGLDGSRQPSFRRAPTPRFGLAGTRAQQAAMSGGVSSPSPVLVSSLPSSPPLENAGSSSVGGHVSPPFEPNGQRSDGQATWYNGVSSPTIDPAGSLRVGRNRGWSDSPSVSRSPSHGDNVDTVPLVLRPGVVQS
ncbi:MAG: hypothetical protein M1816_007594 [Peltula sp. TS41687]|nr:MAG: hypothetical protein M1816_007594 [Peltula sp. TS41687]